MGLFLVGLERTIIVMKSTPKEVVVKCDTCGEPMERFDRPHVQGTNSMFSATPVYRCAAGHVKPIDDGEEG